MAHNTASTGYFLTWSLNSLAIPASDLLDLQGETAAHSPDDPATHAYTPAQEQGGVSGGTGQTSVTS